MAGDQNGSHVSGRPLPPFGPAGFAITKVDSEDAPEKLILLEVFISGLVVPVYLSEAGAESLATQLRENLSGLTILKGPMPPPHPLHGA